MRNENLKEIFESYITYKIECERLPIKEKDINKIKENLYNLIKQENKKKINTIVRLIKTKEYDEFESRFFDYPILISRWV